MTAPPDPRTYRAEDLNPISTSSLPWARAWLRFLLQDVPHGDQLGDMGWKEHSKTDAELDAALSLDAVGQPGNLHYRPHVTAAKLYLGDPSIWKTRAVDGTSETLRSAQEITNAWLDQGRAIDAQIPAELLPVAPSVSQSVRLLRPRSVVCQPELMD